MTPNPTPWVPIGEPVREGFGAAAGMISYRIEDATKATVAIVATEAIGRRIVTAINALKG